MKVRKGVVSNSSSSSYVCDVCGYDVSGWDMCLSEAEMVCCDADHIMCEEHVHSSIRSIGREKLEELCKETEIKPDEYNDEDLADEVWQDILNNDREIPSDICPICQFKNLTQSDHIAYVKYAHALDENIVLGEIRERFKSYREFVEWIVKNSKKES